MLSLEQGEERELMRAAPGDTLTVVDQLPGTDELLVVLRAKGNSEVWRVPMEGSGSKTRVMTTSEDLTTLHVLGAKDATTIYLGKPIADARDRALDVWRLSTNGTFVRLPIDREADSVWKMGGVRISPERRRFVFMTGFQSPTVPLEVRVFGRLLEP